MVTLKLEICIEFVKLTVDLVAAMAESIEVAFRHRPPPQVPYSAGVNGRSHYSTVPIPLSLALIYQVTEVVILMEDQGRKDHDQFTNS
ncbi:hypothetical protein HID58_066733 [Brassica napus]|uniref:BnaC05g26170D protein n=3 Tax=Brassica TaxID=3705 RepID=A0A078G2Y5_BRANA|nr:hypothetical protein HID58_066733 [Brassica napus]CAF1929669.1 unnamed protein product [Brassica napus]CDY20875.1 BnaC05g26170D [Brassica napus]